MPAVPPSFHSENPIVLRLLSGAAPVPIRLAAARAALPLAPSELVHVLYFLSDDAEDGVREAVAATLAGFGDDQFAGFLREPKLEATVLGFLAPSVREKPLALEVLLGNPALSDDTVAALASRVGVAGLDLIVTNQVRLIRAPQIMDAVELNPALTADIRRRIQEVREEFFVKAELLEKLRQAGELPTHELSEAELAAFQEAEIEAAARDAAAGKLVDHEADKPIEPLSEEEDIKKSRLISTLSVPAKVRLALRGSRSDRLVLVRDSNRLVATTVIRSPKMSESEVELIANMRNLTEEVLRIIGTSRNFLRSYGIIHALVRNPRTPVPVAMNLMNRVSQSDLKKLEANRNVTETIRKQAKQLMQRAQQRPGAKS